jgi:hypothetical protein
MPMKEYPLSQEEVFRAELMSFRILISVLMSQFLEQHPERDAALKKMQGAVGQIIVQIPLPAIPPER